MHLLFPESPVERRQPDEFVRGQFEAFRCAGYSSSLISIEALQAGEPKISPPLGRGASILYRGWMLKPHEYQLITNAVAGVGAKMQVSFQQYLCAHYLPNWYPMIREFTADTIVLSQKDATPERLASLGWGGFFIKDYVKSLKTSIGSRITDPAQLPAVLRDMQHFRGDIEGGLCLRKIEDFDVGSEVRYFVINGIPFGPEETSNIPEVVLRVAERIPSPFYSIDVARRNDGVLRVVEVGDGQVSDLVGWSSVRFVEALRKWNSSDFAHNGRE